MSELTYIPNVTTLQLEVDKCNGCTTCTMVCPQAVFAIQDKKAQLVNRDACMECGACARNCPEGALTVRAGVGCAYGIIMGRIRGTEPTCGCDDGCC